MLNIENRVSLESLDTTASQIFDGEITPGEHGLCELSESINVIENEAYVTTKNDGTKLILFRTWRGKGSNLKGYLYTNRNGLKVGSTIEILTFAPLGPEGGIPIGTSDVHVDSSVTKTCYRVSYFLD